MKCFRRLLGISYTDHVVNEEVCRTISRHLKHYEDLLTTVMKRKLGWFGHVQKMEEDNQVKRTMNMEVLGKRPRGRPRGRWIDRVQRDMQELRIVPEDALDREFWKRRISDR